MHQAASSRGTQKIEEGGAEEVQLVISCSHWDDVWCVVSQAVVQKIVLQGKMFQLVFVFITQAGQVRNSLLG
jgi:hypothetical protein